MAQEINETVKEAYNNGANATTDAAAAMMQNVKVKNHALDITSLVLVAVLLLQDAFLTLLLQSLFLLEIFSLSSLLLHSACRFCLLDRRFTRVLLLVLWLQR